MPRYEKKNISEIFDWYGLNIENIRIKANERAYLLKPEGTVAFH